MRGSYDGWKRAETRWSYCLVDAGFAGGTNKPDAFDLTTMSPADKPRIIRRYNNSKRNAMRSLNH